MIPFARGIIFDLELWHWREGRVPIFARMAYYYARPGATDDHPPGHARLPASAGEAGESAVGAFSGWRFEDSSWWRRPGEMLGRRRVD